MNYKIKEANWMFSKVRIPSPSFTLTAAKRAVKGISTKPEGQAVHSKKESNSPVLFAGHSEGPC